MERLPWLDLTFPEPLENLRFDEELLARAQPVLRVWESSRPCVVLGQSSRPERDVHLAECQRESIPVHRRCSGGGAVVIGPGCLNYSLVVPLSWDPRLHDLTYCLSYMTTRMRIALGVEGLREEGICDLALNGRKVSGNAQRRTKEAFLHHGTLLYDFDAALPARLLKPPPRQPPYRANRPDTEFLANLPLDVVEIKRRLAQAWC